MNARETLTVGEVTERLGLAHPTKLREVTMTGRLHIRWNASNILIIRVDRSEVDAEDARRELDRRHLRRLGPTTVRRLALVRRVPRSRAVWRSQAMCAIAVKTIRERLQTRDRQHIVGRSTFGWIA